MTTISLLAFCPARAQVSAEGATYFLPKTAVRISVLVEKTTYQPGDFSAYAQRYLRMPDVSQEPKVSFRVVDIMQTAMPVADTAKVYNVRFNASTVASRVSLTEDGRLLGLNIDDAADATEPAAYVPAKRPQWVNPRQFLSGDILSCGSTAKMAELTAHEVYDLRENRTLLIKGQAEFMPQDGRQMQIMLDELDSQDRALSSLFVGTTVRDTTEHILWVMPEERTTDDGRRTTDGQRQVLFRLSQLHGLVEADDLSGAPYYITLEDISQLPAAEATGKKKGQKTVPGIYVNVPGRLRSTIYEGTAPLLSVELPAPQFGYTVMLGNNLFNKHYSTRLWLDPLSGALLRLDADQPK